MFRIKFEEMLEDNSDKLVIDLRRKEDYKKETYPGAINIYYEEFDRYINILPKNIKIYVFCYTGVSGDEIAEEWSGKGYEIYSIEDGYRAIMRRKVHNIINGGYER